MNELIRNIENIKGPILIFGAGGFIGFNLLLEILKVRKDVFGVFSNPNENWRLQLNPIAESNIAICNINEKKELQALIKEISPRTIFNLAAYGAYARQKDTERIYETNFLSMITIIEELKKYGFDVYIHAGSQSEYGINAMAPSEESQLLPNSHYAVSKVGCYYAGVYYGKIEKLPVVHFRLYSAYGPWEEPDRLIPVLLAKAQKKEYPPFVNPDISRDFVYVSDIVSAFVIAAVTINPNFYGEVFNVATGKKTTIKELAYLVKNKFGIPSKPEFNEMDNREWDIKDWYGNNRKVVNTLNWRPSVFLEEGLEKTVEWQKEIEYDKNLQAWKAKK